MKRFFAGCCTLVLVAIVILGPTGCGKDESKPNPELQIPDIPESGSKTGKKTPEKK